MKLIDHSTAAAVAGTVRLSLRRIGAVSTKPAISGGERRRDRRSTTRAAGPSASVHAASALPARLPKTMNAARPATDFAGFHGSRADRTWAPTSVANPSPAARMPHAAATISSRDGKHSTSASTAIGYSTMPDIQPAPDRRDEKGRGRDSRQAARGSRQSPRRQEAPPATTSATAAGARKRRRLMCAAFRLTSENAAIASASGSAFRSRHHSSVSDSVCSTGIRGTHPRSARIRLASP